jgi:hypothetical protein
MADLPDFVFRATLRRSVLRSKHGITDHELRGPLWRRTMRGHYCFEIGDADATTRRIRDAISVLPPDGAIGGWAAAYLHGVKDLDGRAWSGGLEPVLLVLPYRSRIRRVGIATVRSAIQPDDVTTARLVRVTSPVRTCFDLIRRGSLEDAVVAVDAMLRRKAVVLDELREYVAARAGWKGVPVARAALDLADGRAASCPESRFRVVWQVEAGLPRPEVNCAVHDPIYRFVGIPDLLDPKVGLVGEYDGAQHRQLGQHTADNAREERLEALGLTVVRATSIDLKAGRPRLVARLRDAHRRASERDGPRRWRL